jgi:WD40 repeat protein
LGVSFSPDSRTLVSGSDDTTVRLWDVGSRSCTATLAEHNSTVFCVAFCPKVRMLLLVSDLSDRGWFSQPLHWSFEEHHLFPVEFRAAVRQLVRGHHSVASLLSVLPRDVLELVFVHLARDPDSFPTTPVSSTASKQRAGDRALESAAKTE